jgi:hypothetical protein
MLGSMIHQCRILPCQVVLYTRCGMCHMAVLFARSDHGSVSDITGYAVLQQSVPVAARAWLVSG